MHAVDDRRSHVLPADEKESHDFSMACACHPLLKPEQVVIHFGFEVRRREWIVSTPQEMING